MSKTRRSKSKDIESPLDDFIASLEKVADCGREVELLEQEVAEREGNVLALILDRIQPVMQFVDGPIAVREEWVQPGAASSEEAYLSEPGITLVNNFASTRRKTDPRWLDYSGYKVVYTRSGRLVRIDRAGSFSESEGQVSFWSTEANEIFITPDFSKKHLKECFYAIVTAIENAARSADKGRADLADRLSLLRRIERLLE